MHGSAYLLCGSSLVVVGACADTPTDPLRSSSPIPLRDAAHTTPTGPLTRYVALGTSLSMGVAAAGVLATSQQEDWTAQFARREGMVFTQPLIEAPGCGSPLLAPLASGVRLDGEPASGSTVCAPNASGVSLPANDVAIDGATVHEALRVTPAIAGALDPHRGDLFSRVLAPGQTQVTAMVAQRPDLVSIELGAADLTGVRFGLLLPDVTYTTYETWRRDYDEVVEAVAATDAQGIVIGLPHHLASFPSLRRGAELYADRAEFNALYVDLAANCKDSPNLLFVFAPVLHAVAEGRYAAAHGLPMPTISCADVPDTFDYVLTPADAETIDRQIARMNQHAEALARRHHYGYFELEVLYGRPDLKTPFSVIAFLSSSEPFGPLMSLDGLHPSAAGHRVLADAAVQAIAAREERLVASTAQTR